MLRQNPGLPATLNELIVAKLTEIEAIVLTDSVGFFVG